MCTSCALSAKYESTAFHPSFFSSFPLQFVNHMSLEWLPVYKPNEAERTEPELYARNVRALLARSLQLPALELEYGRNVLTLNITNIALCLSR